MIRVEEALEKRQLRSRLILQIHDELLVETHRDEIEVVREILRTEMEQAAEDLLVPLIADVNQGESWYEAH